MEQQSSLRLLNLFERAIQRLYINYAELDPSHEMNSTIINVLPTFYGKEDEDPHDHLRAVDTTCLMMTKMPEEQS
ncbi:hypothetical protein COLO4_05120 [Corchorus olitorius]|uniref:Uncharacterized protein n=1 Tax=Corchorus olitorius TaxID=93759 RepID=A0A1R3KRT1_9ROSI|nr:hypothetical protein COLO4_05120 [Corchorus olitorius]